MKGMVVQWHKVQDQRLTGTISLKLVHSYSHDLILPHTTTLFSAVHSICVPNVRVFDKG